MLLFFVASCKKETTSTNTIDNLFTETKDNVQRNEPVLLSFGNNTTAQTIVWKALPNTGVSINQVADYATVSFANAGQYTVTALNGNKQATYIVNVINTLYDDIGSKFRLTASKILNVQINQDVDFTVHHPAKSINWSDWTIAGTGSTVKGYSANNNTVTISFQTAGEKYVTITDGTNTETRTIWVTDVPATDKTNVPFIFSDALTIVPTLSTDKKTLYFTTATGYNYQCNTDKIISAADATNNNYKLSYGGVTMASTPCLTITQASCINSFTNMPLGDAPFSINYENKTFTGSINRSATDVYTITFSNNYLINITQKVL